MALVSEQMQIEPRRTLKNDAMITQYKTLQEIFGPLPDWKRGQFLDIENMEPIDILRLWNGIELVTPSAQITAHLLNERNAGFLKLIAPWIQTDNNTFRHQAREINLVVFDPVAEGAPFNTLTSKTGTYTDTTQKRKLGVTIAAGVYKDKLFGKDEFEFYLTGLTQCASLTVMLEECFALMTCAFTNSCRRTSGYEEIDYSKFINLASDIFGAFSLNPQIIWNRITTIQQTLIPDLDAVIVPPNVYLLLKEFGGESRVIQQEVIIPKNIGPDPGVLKGFIDGPRSLTTVNGINFFELQAFHSNSDSKRVIQPLQTRVIIGRFFKADPNIKATDKPFLSPTANDIVLYWMTQTSGAEAKISYKDALQWCWLFGKDKQPSKFLKDFAAHRNRQLDKTGMKPAKWRLLEDIEGESNVNLDEPYDSDTPIPGSTENKKTMSEQDAWRQEFGFLTYNPSAPSTNKTGRFYVPKRIGDINKEYLPNSWILKAAIALNMKVSKSSKNQISLDSYTSKLKQFISLIDNSPWSDPYVEGLYFANSHRLRPSGSEGKINLGVQERKEEREKIYGPIYAQDWPPNIYGGMDLPEDIGNPTSSYPPGFANAVGLRTIAAQVNNGKSYYNEIAGTAAELVRDGEKLVEYFQEYLGSSIVDGKYVVPWIMPADPLQALFDHILQPKKPLFMAYYPQLEGPKIKKPEKGLVPTIENKEEEKLNKFRTPDERNTKAFNIFKKNSFSPDDIDFLKKYLIEDDAMYVPSNVIGKDLWYLIIIGFADQDALFKFSTYSRYESFMKSSFDSLKIKDFTQANILQLFLGENKDNNLKSINFMRTIILGYTKDKIVIEKFLTKKADLKDLPALDKNITDLDETSKKILAKITDGGFVFTTGESSATYDEYIKTVKSKKESIPTSEPGSVSDTGSKPLGYIRTPLTLSPLFLDYLNRKTTSNPVILPGNPDTFWNTVITQAQLNSAQTDTELRKLIFSQKLQNIALSSFPIGLAFGIRTNNLTSLPKQDWGSKKNEDDSDDSSDDLFTTKSSQKKQKKDYSQTVGSFFSSGFADSKPLGVQHRKMDTLPSLPLLQQRVDATTFGKAYSEEFPGPWESNIKFYESISSNAVALFFLAILLSDFSLEIFESLSKIGQKLMNLDFIRTAEEHEMSTCIVMKMGIETIMMVFGRTIVIPSVDGITGAITVSAEFHLGYVRNNPKKIDWLPYCCPNSFVGGQNNEFIRTVEQFHLPNTTGKPSILVVPKPVSETKMDSPINLLNDDTYEAPNNMITSSIYRKYSSSQFIVYVLGTNLMEYEAAKVKTITNYYQSQQHSFVLFQGALRYPNRKGEFDKITPGIGPKGYVEMNTGNAYRAWNGDGKFSPYAPDKLVYW